MQLRFATPPQEANVNTALQRIAGWLAKFELPNPCACPNQLCRDQREAGDLKLTAAATNFQDAKILCF